MEQKKLPMPFDQHTNYISLPAKLYTNLGFAKAYSL
jgi:hypothetical protein